MFVGAMIIPYAWCNVQPVRSLHARRSDHVGLNQPHQLSSSFQRLLRIVAFIAVSGTSFWLQAQPSGGKPSPVFYSGERLQYKVSWLFFRLGTIVVTTEKLPDSSSGDLYRVVVRVESDPAIFFVSVHNEYESTISASAVKPLVFTAREFSGSDTLVTRYVLDDSLQQVRMNQWRDPGHTDRKEETLDSVGIFYEGASMYFLARSLIHSRFTVTVPTLVAFDFFETDITFTGNVTGVSIDAVDEEIETKELYGFAHFVESSLGGLSGEFEGWFTNDEAAIPVLAKMQLTLGTANIELEQWSRGTWSPPLFRKK